MTLVTRRLVLLLVDALLFLMAWVLAYSFRFEFAIPANDSLLAGDNYVLQLKQLLPWIVLSHLVLFWVLHVYRGMIRYSGTTELRAIIAATAIHVGLWALFNLLLSTRSEFGYFPQRIVGPADVADPVLEVIRIPWGILIFYFMASIFATGGVRLSGRLFMEASGRGDRSEHLPTLLVGAGDLADSVLRSLLRGGGSGSLRPDCAVATDASRVGMRLHGVPVVGTIEKIAEAIKEHGIRQVLIALDDQSPEQLRRVVLACENAEVHFRIIPSVADLAVGRVEIGARAIEIEDLLGREPVKLELPEEKNYIRGERVLITGAGGSIGSELARQVARCQAAEVILLGKGENSIFEIQQELVRQYPALVVQAVVADIRDPERMEFVFASCRPGIVFHAAAHKHVPLMESAPDEAFKNNARGTAILVDLSHRYAVRKFVMISSDKAVRPVSIMGATKRFAEAVVFSRSLDSGTAFQVVRFGNVLGSRGSVIPHFKRQIAAGGPVTVTHPDVTRYFMTIPESVSLVLQAGSRREHASLYLLDMGKPVRILDLARNMITLSGLRPDVDVAIEYIGLRPGEKLHEELFTEVEPTQRTEVEKLLVAQPPAAYSWEDMRQILDQFEEQVRHCHQSGVVELLQRFVPDYHPPEGTEFARVELSAREQAPAPLAAPPPAPTPIAVPVAVTPVVEEPPAPEEAAMEPADLFESMDAAEEAPAEAPAPAAEAPAEELAPAVQAAPEVEEAAPTPVEEEPATVEAAVEVQEPEPEPAAPIEEPAVAEVPAAQAPPEPPAPVEPVLPPAPVAPPEPRPVSPETRRGTLVIVNVPKDFDAETLPLILRQLKEMVLGDSDEVVCIAGESEREGLGADQPVVLRDGRPEGALIAEAAEYLEEAAMVILSSARVILDGAGIRRLREALREEGVVAAYADYNEVAGEAPGPVKLLDHEGCFHERFDFGPVLAYRGESIAECGGISEELAFAWQYDLHLRLLEHGVFRHITEPSYSHFSEEKSTAGGALHSPGLGPLGGFSYVFYPEDVEKEVTTVFEAFLRRQGGWLEGGEQGVPYGTTLSELKASVVIPVLNRAGFIGHAVESALSQELDDFEVIVVDNGSTDGTIAVVEKLAAKDERVKLLRGTGTSIASALNQGIRAARGKYICQLDSDDEYAPGCLRRMTDELEKNSKCGLAISYYRLMDKDGKIIEDMEPIKHSGYTRNQILRRDGAGAVRVFAKCVLEEFGLYDEEHYGNFGEDYDMVLKTCEKYEVRRVHEVLYHYRRHEDNTDVTRDPLMKFRNKNRARYEALARRIAANRAAG